MEEVFPLQQQIQNMIDEDIAAGRGDELWQKGIQKKVVDLWWNLADRLIVKYNDGYYTKVGIPEPIIGKSYGYPDWYSRMIGQSPDIHPIWVEPWRSASISNEDIKDTNSMPTDIYTRDFEYEIPGVFDFESKKWIMEPSASVSMPSTAGTMGSVGQVLLSGLVGVAIGFYMSSYKQRRNGGLESEPLLAK